MDAREMSLFLTTAVRRPHLVGAVAPSGAALARTLAAVVPRSGGPVVAELGPGSGSVSRAIAERLPPAGRHVAVEADAGFAEHLRRTCPRAEVVHGDAADLARFVDAPVDAVVSGLPWSLFDEQDQRRILDAVCSVLGPSGAFTTFAYRHAAAMAGARRFAGLLRATFDEVVCTETVWLNLPPAGVFVCRRPRG